jgi:acyl CoA:acetate/3-ketoacid CoA transferase
MSMARRFCNHNPFKVDVAIVRGAYADSRCNISSEEEAIDGDVHTMALAAHDA